MILIDSSAFIEYYRPTGDASVRRVDLIIAASALEADTKLYHLDGHFQRIAEHSELAERHLGDSSP